MDANGHTSAHPQAHNMSTALTPALLWLPGGGPPQLMMSYVFFLKNKTKTFFSQIHSHAFSYFRAEWRNLSRFMNNKENDMFSRFLPQPGSPPRLPSQVPCGPQNCFHSNFDFNYGSLVALQVSRTSLNSCWTTADDGFTQRRKSFAI